MAKFDREQLFRPDNAMQQLAPAGISDLPHYDIGEFARGLRAAVQLGEAVVPWAVTAVGTLFRFCIPPDDFVMKIDLNPGLTKVEIEELTLRPKVILDKWSGEQSVQRLKYDLMTIQLTSDDQIMEQAAASNHAHALAPKFVDKPLAVWVKDNRRVGFSIPTIDAPFYDYQGLMSRMFLKNGVVEEPLVEEDYSARLRLQTEFHEAIRAIREAGILVDTAGRNFAFLGSNREMLVKIIDLGMRGQGNLYKSLPR